MKRLLSFTFSLFFALPFLSAQTSTMEVTGSRDVQAVDGFQAVDKVQMGRDTIWDYTTRATGYTIYGGGTNGYVFGLGSDGSGNVVSDEIAVHFDWSVPATVTEVYMWVGAKNVTPPSDVIGCKLYASQPDSLPGQLLALGNANMAFIDSTSTVTFNTFAGFNLFVFDQGTPDVTSDFLVGLSFAGNDDTLGLVSTVQGDGLNERRAKLLLSPQFGGTWISADDFWTIGGFPLNADPIIVPVLELAPMALDEGFNQKNLHFMPAYPNPATDQTTLRYSLKTADNFQVSILDVTGRTVYDSGTKFETAGDHELTIDVSDWPQGKYFYTVRTDETSITSRFFVIR